MGEDAAMPAEIKNWKPSPELGEFVKHDGTKPRTDLLPPRALLAVSRVLTLGAAKYGAYNWKKCPDPARLVAASLRHILAHMTGEERDPESGESHLAHAVCSLLFLLELRDGRP